MWKRSAPESLSPRITERRQGDLYVRLRSPLFLQQAQRRAPVRVIPRAAVRFGLVVHRGLLMFVIISIFGFIYIRIWIVSAFDYVLFDVEFKAGV
jgi:hypothetical protein